MRARAACARRWRIQTLRRPRPQDNPGLLVSPTRRGPTGPRRSARLFAAFALAAVAIVGWHLAARDHDAPSSTRSARVDKLKTKPSRPKGAPSRVAHLRAIRGGLLSVPVQDAAVAGLDGSHALLLGGLSAADTSTAAVRVAGPAGDRALTQLPAALHDAAAVRIGGNVYLFGG